MTTQRYGWRAAPWSSSSLDLMLVVVERAVRVMRDTPNGTCRVVTRVERSAVILESLELAGVVRVKCVPADW